VTARVAISPLAYVPDGREAVGHVLARGRAGFTWDGPSWRASAKDYHEQRASRRTSETISPGRLAHLRRLMADDISIDRAWHELKADRTAPKATVDALMYSLRRGTEALAVSDNKRRLSELSEEQLRAVCHQLRNFKPEIAPAWTLEEVEALVIIWSELK
jgi:hypothetical protein